MPSLFELGIVLIGPVKATTMSGLASRLDRLFTSVLEAGVTLLHIQIRSEGMGKRAIITLFPLLIVPLKLTQAPSPSSHGAGALAICSMTGSALAWPQGR